MISFESDSCLLVIDIQEDNKSVYNYKQLQKNISKLIDFARKKNVLIYYIYFIRNHNSYWYNFKKELIAEIPEEGPPLEFIIPHNNECMKNNLKNQRILNYLITTKDAEYSELSNIGAL